MDPVEQCVPGTMMRDKDGTWWECGEDGLMWAPMSVPTCTESQVLVYTSQGFVCRGPMYDNTILWLILIMASVFTLGALAMGLREWWKRRKERKLPPPETFESWKTIFPSETTRVDPEGILPPGTWHFEQGPIIKEEPVTTEELNAIQNEIRDIYMEVALARGELNKITKMAQISVDSAMSHLNVAVPKVAALGGKIK